MSTQPVYAHLFNNVVVRAHMSPHGVVFLRDGVRVVSYDAHPNHPVSFSSDGKVLFRDMHSHAVIVDSQQPKESRQLQEGITVVHPDGQHGVAMPYGDYPYKAPDGTEVAGHLVKVELETGVIVERWPTTGPEPRRVHVFGGRDDALPAYKKERWRAPSEGILHAPKELVLAGDPDEHWALVAADRLVIGRGGTVLCDVYWFAWSFYPPAGVFDLDRGCFYVAGKTGIVAFDLGGDVRASWWSTLPDAGPYTPAAAVMGPVLLHGDELLAVTHVGVGAKTHGKPEKYVVRRFDPDTLTLRGDFEGFKPRRLGEGASRLLSTPSGALLWIPSNGAVAVSSTSVWPHPRTDEIYVTGDEAPPRFAPTPDDDPSGEDVDGLADTTPAQRRGLARFLLELGQRDKRFQLLAEQDPDAFRPWANTVLGLADALVIGLQDMDRHAFYWVTRDASNEAVDACAATIPRDPSTTLTTADSARVLLLCGVLTGHALEVLGELGRAHPMVRSLMWEHHLETVAEGPAVIRFSPQLQAIVGVETSDPALRSGRELAATTSRCHKPAQHLLSVDVGVHPALTSTRLPEQHFLLCNCELCDAWLENNHWHFNVEGLASTAASEGACAGDGRAPATAKSFAFSSIKTSEFQRVGVLGGRAQWWQQSEVPACPTCKRMMFFVGQLKAGSVRDDMPDAGLWGFHCERCGEGVQVMQIT